MGKINNEYNDTMNIALLTTVINSELYRKSSQLFPQNIQKYIIDGTNGMHSLDSIFYMMKKLKGKGIEWLIMADEDVLFVNPNGVYSIIEEMKSNNYLVSGVRDGGVIPNRTYSPYLINTFFSIINFKELELIWNEKEIKKNQYILENEFEIDLSKFKENYDLKSLYEPYYCFYFWLRRKNKKILFLNASTPFIEDGITTMIKDSKEEILLYHTWYARSYGINEKHTKRIDLIFNLLKFENSDVSEPIYFKHKTFHIIKKIRKLRQRIIMRIEIIKKNIIKK